MSFEPMESVSPAVVMGNVLPTDKGVNQEATHLYISLSELIADAIFYHPGLVAQEAQDKLSEADRQALNAIISEQNVAEHFVETLVSKIKAAAEQQTYSTMRLCLSEADSYEYKALIGGSVEAEEVNPAMGLRGVSRLASANYSDAFSLQCDVIKALQQQGITIEIVVPFVRALSDAATIIDRLAEKGLPRGLNGLKVLYSCDVPSAALLADKLLQYFDGIVINVDHLTQFTLGVDKYNQDLEYLYKSDNEAVIALMDVAVKAARHAKKPALVVTSSLDEHPKLKELLAETLKVDTLFSF